MPRNVHGYRKANRDDLTVLTLTIHDDGLVEERRLAQCYSEEAAKIITKGLRSIGAEGVKA